MFGELMTKSIIITKIIFKLILVQKERTRGKSWNFCPRELSCSSEQYHVKRKYWHLKFMDLKTLACIGRLEGKRNDCELYICFPF